MASNQEIGQIGENLAAKYLEASGYIILHQNWRFSHAEIDIICQKDDHLIFVEVKTRSYIFYGDPAESITSKKEALIMDGANAYMQEVGYEWKFRFDIISIILDSHDQHQIDHVEDAFFPGW